MMSEMPLDAPSNFFDDAGMRSVLNSFWKGTYPILLRICEIQELLTGLEIGGVHSTSKRTKK